MGEFFSSLWNVIILQPVVNSLIWLSTILLYNFGLTIIAFTIVIRLLMFPLTIKQLHATKALQTLQPQLAKLQKKYAKDKQRLAKEQMELYRQSGVSPAGCMVPMLVQMPIWIALYQSIMKALAITPEDFLGLSRYLYSWQTVHSALPLSNGFLWLDLATPDTFLILPILVGGTMWLQQKQVTPPSVDPAQESRNRLMLWMMPLMFSFFTLSFPSGLALYWVASNIISILIQYRITGSWGFGAPKIITPPPPVTAKERKKLAAGPHK